MAAETKTYEGWTNYETWKVKQWIDKEYGDYCYWKETTEEIWMDAEPNLTWSKSATALYELADQLKQQIGEDDVPEDYATGVLYADLLNAALSEVNWHEIANALLEDNECEGYEPKD